MMMAFRKLNSSYRGLLSKACLKKQTGTSSLLTSQQARLCAAECGTYTRIEQDGVHQAVAILKMNNKPFNGFNKPFLDEMSHRLDELRSTGSCQGVIITSANAGIFSAGLDISEIYQISQDCAAALWRSLIEFIMRLYGTNLVTVAAVNGHATAGGCLLSLSCDYRIMAEGKFNIGFSATQLGLITPFWVQEMMSKACGARTAEISFQKGLLYTPEQALAIRLVDELQPAEDLMAAARKQMLKWLAVPEHARVRTKSMQRAALIEKVQSSKEEEIQFFANFLLKESVQEAVGKYLETLKKRK
ncbi:enoyl-CoA delta isomerase 1, mitochondrial-like isoform X2 [Acanthaster planci]|nr:enoyl-CoA delta isomerase 1, mitochondrial-like isoform X2 [Acanthaster planci]